MAGGSTSEEMDAVDPWGDVTPDKPVSIYDLDEDLPTRAQSSDEIAEYQRLLREKREAAFRSFKPPRDSSPAERPSAPSSVRPIPRESGPVRIDRLRVPPPMPGGEATEATPPDLDEVLSDVAATIARLPPAPRVPRIEEPRGSLEVIPALPSAPPPARPPAAAARAPVPAATRTRRALIAAIVVLSIVIAIGGLVALLH